MIKDTTIGLFLSFIALGAIVMLSSCVTPTPIPPPPNPPIESVDAPILQPTSFQQLCDKLSQLGCAEGDDPDCAFVFEMNDDNAATVANLNVDCLKRAQNVADVKACKSVECKPKHASQSNKELNCLAEVQTKAGVMKCETMARSP